MSDYIKQATREAIKKEFNNCCAACGCGDEHIMEIDHVQPETYYKRGRMAIDNSARNLQLLCRPCNNRKNGIEYMKRLAPKMPVYDCRIYNAERVKWFAVCDGIRKDSKLF